MISIVFVLVLFYSKLIDFCDTASFVTAPPELIDSENDLLVKGYLGFNYIRDIKIILENVTWYEARDICQQQGFGLLENTTHTNFRQSIVTGALNDTQQFFNLSMWTGYFRSNVAQDDWAIVGKENACYPTELQFDSSNTEYQCAINRYEVTGQEPKFEMRNCTDKLPFVCKDRTDESINFTKYSEYDVLYTPIGASLILDWYFDLEGCLDKCKRGGFCVGFSFTVLTGECRWVRADFGVQALQYEIHHSGALVSHYVKMGYDAIVIENSSYVDDLDEVMMYVECELDPAGSTTPSSGSPASPTQPSRTDPQTTTTTTTTTTAPPQTTTTSTTAGTSSSTTTLPLIFPGPTPPPSTSTTRISQTTTTTSPSSTTTIDPSTSTGKTTTMKTETSDTATSDHTTTTAPPPTTTTPPPPPPTTTTTQTTTPPPPTTTTPPPPPTTTTTSTQTAFTTSSTVTVTPKATKTSTTTTPRTSSSSSITSVSTPSSTTVGGTSSTSASTTGSTTVATVNTTECLCICNTTDKHNNATAEQIEEMIEILIQNLTIKRKETYNYKITLECAEDDRPSARAMGVVAAIVMCFVFGPIVIADVFNIVKHFSFIHGLRRQI